MDDLSIMTRLSTNNIKEIIQIVKDFEKVSEGLK
jgi:hypothetical protein